MERELLAASFFGAVAFWGWRKMRSPFLSFAKSAAKLAKSQHKFAKMYASGASSKALKKESARANRALSRMRAEKERYLRSFGAHEEEAKTMEMVVKEGEKQLEAQRSAAAAADSGRKRKLYSPFRDAKKSQARWNEGVEKLGEKE